MRFARITPAALIAALALAAAGAGASSGHVAARVAAEACSAKVKAQRAKALSSYRKQMRKRRAAYFRTHKWRRQRAAFVQKQLRRLKALRAALAACSKPAPSQAEAADLGVALSVAPAEGTLSPPTDFSYTLTISNAGPARALATARVSTGSQHMTQIAPPPGWACRDAGELSCTSTIAAGTAATVRFVTRPTAAGQLATSASVSSPTRDPRSANNTASATVTVAGPTEPPPPPPPSPPVLPPGSTGPPCSPTLSAAGAAQMNEGPTDYALALAPEGEVKALMLFVDFSDAATTETTTDLHSLLAPHSARWYAEGSYGRMSLAIAARHTWYRMPRPSGAYGFADGVTFAEHRAYIADAIAAADADVDFRQYRIVYVVAAKGAALPVSPAFHAYPGSGVTVDRVEIRHSATFGADIRSPRANYGANVLIHETGHLFGLPDLYLLGAPSPSFLDPAGGWDPMSWVAPGAHFMAWHKWKLGWLTPAQVRCLGVPGTHEETLTPIAIPGGVKAVVVPTGPSTAYVVEARTRTGFDSGLCSEGVLVYTVDARVASGDGPILVKRSRNGGDAAALSQCGPGYDASFATGPGETSTFEDAAMRLDVLVSSPQGYRIRVTRK